MNAMRVVTIVLECSSNNLGDRAIARSLSDILSPHYNCRKASFSTLPEPNSEVNLYKTDGRQGVLKRCFSWMPPIIKSRIKWRLFGEKNRFREYYGQIAQQSDLIIIGGGQLIKNNIDLFCEKVSLLSLVAGAHGVPVAVMGVGADRGMTAYTWRIVRKALNSSRAIIARDDLTFDRIKSSMSIRSAEECRLLTAPDFVFALRNDKLREEDRSDRAVDLAINVMDLNAMLLQTSRTQRVTAESLVDGICSIASAGRCRGDKVQLFTTGAGEDLVAANKIRDEFLGKKNVSLEIFHPTSLGGLMAYLINVDKVVACRMHSGILSFISGCRPICVNWDDKVMGVWGTIDEENRVVEIDCISSDSAGEYYYKKIGSVGDAKNSDIEAVGRDIEGVVLNAVQEIFEKQ